MEYLSTHEGAWSIFHMAVAGKSESNITWSSKKWGIELKDFTWKKQLSIQEWIKSSKEKKKSKEPPAYSDSEWGEQRRKMHRKWEAKLEHSVTKKKKKKPWRGVIILVMWGAERHRRGWRWGEYWAWMTTKKILPLKQREKPGCDRLKSEWMKEDHKARQEKGWSEAKDWKEIWERRKFQDKRDSSMLKKWATHTERS